MEAQQLKLLADYKQARSSALRLQNCCESAARELTGNHRINLLDTLMN